MILLVTETIVLGWGHCRNHVSRSRRVSGVQNAPGFLFVFERAKVLLEIDTGLRIGVVRTLFSRNLDLGGVHTKLHDVFIHHFLSVLLLLVLEKVRAEFGVNQVVDPEELSLQHSSEQGKQGLALTRAGGLFLQFHNRIAHRLTVNNLDWFLASTGSNVGTMGRSSMRQTKAE